MIQIFIIQIRKEMRKFNVFFQRLEIREREKKSPQINYNLINITQKPFSFVHFDIPYRVKKETT